MAAALRCVGAALGRQWHSRQGHPGAGWAAPPAMHQPPPPHPALHCIARGLALMRAGLMRGHLHCTGWERFRVQCNPCVSVVHEQQQQQSCERLASRVLSVQPEQGPVQLPSCQSDLSAVVVAGSSDQRPCGCNMRSKHLVDLLPFRGEQSDT